jgi:hypothetical protein
MTAFYLRRKRDKELKKNKDWRAIIRAIRYEAKLQQRIKKHDKNDLYVQLFY